MLCLAEELCCTINFRQSSNQCEIFLEVPGNNGNLLANSGTVVMIVIDRVRVPSVVDRTTTSTTTTTTTATTTTTTYFAQATSYWPLDGNGIDQYGINNATPVNGPSYVSPGINGYGNALYCSVNANSYLSSSTFRNLTYRSFTIELWLYALSLSTDDYGLFGQRQQPVFQQLLHYVIRNYRLLMGFYGDDATGGTDLSLSRWYHVGFVYDYSSLTQYIYLNGVQDTVRSPAGPYQGQAGALNIGMIYSYNNASHSFDGYIDQVTLTMRSKTAAEILDDATLTCYFSFDAGSYLDSGPNNLIGTGNNLSLASGRNNQAIRFVTSSSYFQATSFVLLGTNNLPFSYSMWIFRTTSGSGTLIHFSSLSNGQGWCVDLLGFSSSGQIVSTFWSGPLQVIGPVIPVNSWTHIAATYSSANGGRLYVNGSFIGSTGAMQFMTSGTTMFITLGSELQGIPSTSGGTCGFGSISPGPYYGLIDEFRVYSRELSISDVTALAI